MYDHELETLTARNIRPVYHWVAKEQFMKAEDYHPAWVLFAIEEGRFEYQIGEERGICSAGEMALCPPGLAFRRKIWKTLSFFVANLQWHMPDGSLLPADHPLAALMPVVKFRISDTTRLGSTFAYLADACAGSTSVPSMRQNFLINDIWLLYCYDSGKSSQLVYDRDPEISRAVQVINQEGYRPFSMKSLSGELGLSPVQFTRRFKSVVGMTPVEYLTGLRIRKAQKLLAESRHTLEKIAEQCGYENGFYLSRIFTKKVGMSPRQYRETHSI